METSNGTITLEYITELQAKVSTAMSNGELPLFLLLLYMKIHIDFILL